MSEADNIKREIDGIFSEKDEMQMDVMGRYQEMMRKLEENGFHQRPHRVEHLPLSRKIVITRQDGSQSIFSVDDLEKLKSGEIELTAEDREEFERWYGISSFNYFSQLRELDDRLKELTVDEAGEITDMERRAKEISANLEPDLYQSRMLEYEYGESDPERQKLLKSILRGEEE